MKHRSLFLFFILIFAFPVCVFSQQAPSAVALRDYVGLINQSYHPGIVAFFEKIKTDLARKGENDAVRAIDIFLRGSTGSGFVFNDARGNLYAITNNHVIAQAHSLSITFERQDGFKKKIENLNIIAVDEEADLALLAFPAGDKPLDRGLSFLTRPVQEGEDVYSAGFPGLGITSIWQFGRGMVSNAAVRFPKSINDETLVGPFIQHTAEVDSGNSGGPLLIIQQNVPSGYAVAGINTLKAYRRQAANYAIPVSTVQNFINDALNQKPETYRAALDQRLVKFTEGLGANRAVYPHIAEYLSSVCVGENAEFAMSEMYDKGNASVKRTFIEKCEDGVVGAMGYAVAWTIENSIRGQGAIKASLKEVTGDGEEYTVVFTVNNKDHSSKWVREYGNWRIRSFSAVAAGDKTLVSKKEAQKKTAEKLRVDNNNLHLEAGYAYLFEKAPAALYTSIDYMGIYKFKLYATGSDFWAFGMAFGYRWGIPAGNLGFMPYIHFGFDYLHDQEYEDFKDATWSAGLPVALVGQTGVKITSSYVSGLFVGLTFQYNIFDLMSKDYDKAMKMGFSITAGYAF
ncbi:MAG: serine protease [Treponema sp.]|jgi:serine protease Do|nr:serine protease [Treponema sp.]